MVADSVAAVAAFGGTARYQPEESGMPLNGPTTSLVIQPP